VAAGAALEVVDNGRMTPMDSTLYGGIGAMFRTPDGAEISMFRLPDGYAARCSNVSATVAKK
jgi:hypothetical protein